MSPDDALRLCKFAKSACPAQAIDQDTPAAWFMLLSDLRFEDAMQALVNVVRTQPFVAPAEIRAEVKKMRAKRLDAFGPIPDPPAEVGDDPEVYRKWRAGVQRRIADGEVTEAAQLGLPRLTGGQRPKELESVFRSPDDED